MHTKRSLPGMQRWAALAAALCAVECALMPLLPLALPSFAVAGVAGEVLHAGVAWLVLPASAALLGVRLRRRRDALALALGGLGAAAIACGAVLGWDSLGGHVSTLVAGTALAIAHMRGRRVCVACSPSAPGGGLAAAHPSSRRTDAHRTP